MLKIIFILGAFAVVVNVLFISYAKRRGHNTKADKSPTHKEGSDAASHGFLNSEEGKILYYPADSLSNSCSHWITINPAEFVLAPGEVKI